MAVGNNPTKIIGSEKFLPALQIMIEGYSKEDPPTRKMLLIETDVPQLLVELGYSESGTAHAQAIGDLTLIAFYYLLLNPTFLAPQALECPYGTFFLWNESSGTIKRRF
jgi:hypothetical protein